MSQAFNVPRYRGRKGLGPRGKHLFPAPCQQEFVKGSSRVILAGGRQFGRLLFENPEPNVVGRTTARRFHGFFKARLCE